MNAIIQRVREFIVMWPKRQVARTVGTSLKYCFYMMTSIFKRSVWLLNVKNELQTKDEHLTLQNGLEIRSKFHRF